MLRFIPVDRDENLKLLCPKINADRYAHDCLSFCDSYVTGAIGGSSYTRKSGGKTRIVQCLYPQTKGSSKSNTHTHEGV